MHGPGMFVGALVAVYLLPGADMILLLQTGAREGRTAAWATAVGLAVARAGHVALAALGLAALLRASPWAFEAVRLVGVAYLIWLGVGILRAEGADLSVPGGAAARPGLVRAARRGFATNIANPKALLFCSVLLPQFVPQGAGAFGRFLELGAILVAIGFGFDTLYALAGSAIGRLLQRSRTARRIQQWTFGCLLIGFGARLALAGRPG